MASTEAGREILKKVGDRILEQAKPQLLHLVKESVQKRAILIDVHLNVANGNMVGFFSLE